MVLNCHLNLLLKYVVSHQCANTELGTLNINKLCQPSKWITNMKTDTRCRKYYMDYFFTLHILSTFHRNTLDNLSYLEECFYYAFSLNYRIWKFTFCFLWEVQPHHPGIIEAQFIIHFLLYFLRTLYSF